jgi:hypothetical protein
MVDSVSNLRRLTYSLQIIACTVDGRVNLKAFGARSYMELEKICLETQKTIVAVGVFSLT